MISQYTNATQNQFMVWLLAIGAVAGILMVISDGAPVDDSTLSTNTSDYLEANLKKTVKWIENKTNIELLAIGIGHDVTRYYNRAVKITDVQDLGDVMINQLTDLFVEENRKTIH